MPGLPFFKLPELNQEAFLQQLEFHELLKFGLTSKKAMKYARCLGRLFFEEMFASIYEDHMEVYLHSRNQTVSITFKILYHRVLDRPSDRPWNAIKTCEWTGFNGQRVEEYEETADANGKKGFIYLVFPSRDFATGARELLRTIVESFGDCRICLTFSPRPIVLPLVNFFKRLPVIKLTVMYTDFYWTPLNGEVIHNILEFNVTDYLFIAAKVLEGVQYDIGFTTPKVTIQPAHWVHLNAILNSTTADFMFGEGPYPSAEFLKSILSHWISNQRMKNLVRIGWYHWRNRARNWPEGIEEMIQGLGEAVVDKESLSREEKQKLEREEGAGKFIRRADQRLAVVAMDFCSFYVRVIPI